MNLGHAATLTSSSVGVTDHVYPIPACCKPEACSENDISFAKPICGYINHSLPSKSLAVSMVSGDSSARLSAITRFLGRGGSSLQSAFNQSWSYHAYHQLQVGFVGVCGCTRCRCGEFVWTHLVWAERSTPDSFWVPSH